MLLPDFLIRQRASLPEGDRRRLGITPFDHDSVQPASYDLHLGNDVLQLYSQPGSALDPAQDNAAHFLHRTMLAWPLYPGEFLLASTSETVDLPADVAAELRGRSSLGRLGLQVHATAGFVDPGFKGQITLELSNVGPMTILLKPGLRIAQLTFMELAAPATAPYGHPSRDSKYQDQMGATASRSHQDREHAQRRGVSVGAYSDSLLLAESKVTPVD